MLVLPGACRRKMLRRCSGSGLLSGFIPLSAARDKTSPLQLGSARPRRRSIEMESEPLSVKRQRRQTRHKQNNETSNNLSVMKLLHRWSIQAEKKTSTTHWSEIAGKVLLQISTMLEHRPLGLQRDGRSMPPTLTQPALVFSSRSLPATVGRPGTFKRSTLQPFHLSQKLSPPFSLTQRDEPASRHSPQSRPPWTTTPKRPAAKES